MTALPCHPATLARTGIALAVGLALAVTAPATRADAADIGQCDTPEAITALLKTEGQRSLAYGNQADTGNALIFTAGADGRGYIVKGDRPLGTKATRMCITDRFGSVKVFDNRQPGIPDEVRAGSRQDAARRCPALAKEARIPVTSCGHLGTMLAAADPKGERVMILARDGDMMIAVTGSPETGTGAVLYAFLPEGAAMIGMVMTGTGYTEVGLATR